MLLDFSSLTTEQKFEQMNSTELLDHFWQQVTKRWSGSGNASGQSVWHGNRCVFFASAGSGASFLSTDQIVAGRTELAARSTSGPTTHGCVLKARCKRLSEHGNRGTT